MTMKPMPPAGSDVDAMLLQTGLPSLAMMHAGDETEDVDFNGGTVGISPPSRQLTFGMPQPEPTPFPGASVPAPFPDQIAATPTLAANGISPGIETDLEAISPGIDGIVATPVIAPIVAAGAVAAIRALVIRFGGRLSVGLFVAFIRRWGSVAVKMAIGVLAFNELMDLVGLGAPAETIIDVKLRKKRKRYSIGYNPRVQTLQKVARHTMKLLKRHQKYINEFFPKKKVTYGIPPGKALSAIERAAIKG